MSKITVIVVEPSKKPYVKEIENTLKSFRHEVDGYIQAVYFFLKSSTKVSAFFMESQCGYFILPEARGTRLYLASIFFFRNYYTLSNFSVIHLTFVSTM